MFSAEKETAHENDNADEIKVDVDDLKYTADAAVKAALKKAGDTSDQIGQRIEEAKSGAEQTAGQVQDVSAGITDELTEKLKTNIREATAATIGKTGEAEKSTTTQKVMEKVEEWLENAIGTDKPDHHSGTKEASSAKKEKDQLPHRNGSDGQADESKRRPHDDKM